MLRALYLDGNVSQLGKPIASVFVFAVIVFPSLLSSSANAGLFDLIDDVFRTGGARPYVVGTSLYDVFNISGTTVSLGIDGLNDIQVIVTQNNPGTINNVSFDESTFRNGTGVGSAIQSSGAPNINNPRTVASQTIEIRFLSSGGFQVLADDFLNASISSANTINPSADTNAWESSALQFLDTSYTPFSTYAYRPYVDNQIARGVTGAGTIVADGDTQDGVGTADAIDDASGGENLDNPALDASNRGLWRIGALTSTTQIGGLLLTHVLTDTRGTSDTGGFDYTATLNEFNVNVTAVPEPSSMTLLSIAGFGLIAVGYRCSRKVHVREAAIS